MLEASSKAILHVGGIGDASVLKIATNMVTASTVQTLAEALALVRGAGIPGAKLVEALENNGTRSGTSDLKLPAMIAGNFEPNFSLKHMLKDTRLALNLADGLELSLPVTETAAEVLSLGMANGWGDQDFCCVTQLYPVPETPEAAAAVDCSPSVPEAARNPLESAAPPLPDRAGAPETLAPTVAASGAAGVASAAQPAVSRGRTVPQLGQSLTGIKESALRAFRGFLKAPKPKVKTAPVPVAGKPDREDTILPTEGLPPGEAPSGGSAPPPEPSQPSNISGEPAAPVPSSAPDAPPEAAGTAPESAAAPVLAPDR